MQYHITTDRATRPPIFSRVISRNYIYSVMRSLPWFNSYFHQIYRKFDLIESTKTTSMEDVRTGVLEKNKEYLRRKDKAKKDMMYQDIYNCICQNTKKWRYTIQYVKPTAQLVFKNRFPKGGPTCRRQVVNPRHQTSQGQSVAKPETPLQNIQVEKLDVTSRGPMAPCWIRCSERRSRDRNILGGEGL